MSSKEIKSRLKAAKAAVDEKDHEKALERCQVCYCDYLLGKAIVGVH